RLTTEVFAMALSVLERELECGEQSLGLGIALRGSRYGDVHPADRVDLVVFDLGKDDLLLDAHVEVSAAVERARRYTAKVAHARQRDRNQSIEKFIHPFLPQRDHAADRITSSDLPHRNRLLRFGDHRLLAGDFLHVPDG